jgi:hypothetical protein
MKATDLSLLAVLLGAGLFALALRRELRRR